MWPVVHTEFFGCTVSNYQQALLYWPSRGLAEAVQTSSSSQGRPAPADGIRYQHLLTWVAAMVCWSQPVHRSMPLTITITKHRVIHKLLQMFITHTNIYSPLTQITECIRNLEVSSEKELIYTLLQPVSLAATSPSHVSTHIIRLQC